MMQRDNSASLGLPTQSAAAAALEAAGLTCLLLEGRDALGGRIRSSPSGIDLGAQWVHGDGNTPPNPLLELARKSRLPLRPFDYDNALVFDAATGAPAPSAWASGRSPGQIPCRRPSA